MRRCLVEPIPQLDLAANLLSAAADALLQNNKTLAAELIVRADDPAIVEYAMRIVGKLTKEVHRSTRLPRRSPTSERVVARMPSEKVQEAIFKRDGWRCRFCGIKVISRRARRTLISLFPNETHWTSKDVERHSALSAMAVSLDHVVPHSRGGTNEIANFVTSCYCCQFGRGELTIEEVELDDPRSSAPLIDGWDGLSRISELPRAA